MNQMNDEILTCEKLCKSYGKKVALTDIDLHIGRGRIVGLLGPNGSGKTTLIKLACGLLSKTSGDIRVGGKEIGVETKKVVSYLPERTYIPDWMKVNDIIDFFEDFYSDFKRETALKMLESLKISPTDKFKTMSKGTKEKLQLVLVMSREAELYLLDEPIAGVDPAARDYILRTIISNYNENATIIISTHLITDIEPVLDEVIMIHNGVVKIHSTVDEIREQNGMSVDELFREVFKC